MYWDLGHVYWWLGHVYWWLGHVYWLLGHVYFWMCQLRVSRYVYMTLHTFVVVVIVIDLIFDIIIVLSIDFMFKKIPHGVHFK